MGILTCSPTLVKNASCQSPWSLRKWYRGQRKGSMNKQCGTTAGAQVLLQYELNPPSRPLADPLQTPCTVFSPCLHRVTQTYQVSVQMLVHSRNPLWGFLCIYVLVSISHNLFLFNLNDRHSVCFCLHISNQWHWDFALTYVSGYTRTWPERLRLMLIFRG